MEIISGQRVSEGIAIGRCLVLSTRDVRVKETYIAAPRVGAEVRRFRRALQDAESDIRQIQAKTASGREDVARIVDTSLQMLQDPFLARSIEEKITETHCSAAYAVSQVLGQMAEHLQAIDNPIFSSKVNDVHDMEHRLINHLLGGELERLDDLKRPVIIVADDLSPTQAATLDRRNILGFATERGSWASHTAILARALGIPAVVGVPRLAQAATMGSMVIIDGSEAKVVLDPTDKVLEQYRIERRRVKRAADLSKAQRSLRAETKDGLEFEIVGNIETKDDVSRVVEQGGAGIGLFRTEFIYLGRQEPPDEEQQYEHYSTAVREMAPGGVTIRTMDFGGDKFDRRTNDGTEANPFMGERAIRVSFKHEELFRTQLRAILRAAVHGAVRLMFPMIMDVGEFRRARSLVVAAAAELDKSGLPYRRDVQIGTMIELPSAALNAVQLSREVDFFSIGTNDLTQFCLGVDRTNHRVSSLFQPHHPCVLRLIREVVKAGKTAKKPVSLCGEMAGNAYYTPLLLGLGVECFSVSPPQIPNIKRAIRSVYLARCHHLADESLGADDAPAVKTLLDHFHG